MARVCQRGKGTLAESQAAKAMTDENRRLYALCGVVAPIFFFLMVQVEHLLIPSFGWMTQQTSDLGAWALYGSYALLQNVNFVTFGILVIALAVGFRQKVVGSRAMAIPLGLFGVAFFLLGFFPDQPMPWPGAAHDLISWVGGVSLLLAQFYAWRRLSRLSIDMGGRLDQICYFFTRLFRGGPSSSRCLHYLRTAGFVSDGSPSERFCSTVADLAGSHVAWTSSPALGSVVWAADCTWQARAS